MSKKRSGDNPLTPFIKGELEKARDVNYSPLEKGDKGGCFKGRFEAGFSLVELLIAMVMFVLTIAAASQMFTAILTQFKQQSKIAETNIEGIIGLEILRQDLEHAGYGLPWVYPVTLTGYVEATTEPADRYNDTSATPPRAILSCNGDNDSDCEGTLSGSDYLVIKAINVASNDASRKSTRLIATVPYVPSHSLRTWTLPDGVTPDTNENLETKDRVIVISSGNDTTQNTLVTSGTFYTTYGNVTNAPWLPTDPTDPASNRIVYGINDSTAKVPTMPFNRADYYIATPDNFPSRCATGTGVLYKGTVNHGDGELTELPLLDCVADMQVVYQLDTNDDGTLEQTDDIITVPLTHQQIREQIKEVRVYILAHEGQKDPNYTFDNFSGIATCATCITVGEFGLGRDFALLAITDYLNYRWKVYTIVVKPENLRGI